MHLIHITEDKCKICAAPVIREEIDHDHRGVRLHCNGDRWETRTFGCGRSTQYIPNFRACEDRSACSNSKEYKQLFDKRMKLHNTLIDVVNRADVDAEWQSRVVSYLPKP